MRTQLSRLVRMNIAERRGVFALILLSLIFVAAKEVVLYREEHLPLPNSAEIAEKALQFQEKVRFESEKNESQQAEMFAFDPNTITVEDLGRLGVPEWLALRLEKYRNKGGKFKDAASLANIYGMPPALYEKLKPYVEIQEDTPIETERQAWQKSAEPLASAPELFAFDPNTSTKEEFLKLGISERVAQQILNYRGKGGRFRHSDDFAKMYGITPTFFETLKPFIAISVDQTPIAQQAPSSKPSVEKTILVNQADVAEWQTLKGIGPYFAQKIVNYRDKLGGFANLEMIAKTNGLPDSVFQKIKSQLVLSPLVQKIDINNIDEQTLNKHPLFDFKQSKIIVNYRAQHGKYASLQQIVAALPNPNEAWLKSIEPYLDFK